MAEKVLSKNSRRIQKKGRTDFGGEIRKQNCLNFGKKKGKIPFIQNVENNVLKCIIAQDEQVRQILIAIYKSLCFSSMKTNMLLIGKSGCGKTETIQQIAGRLHIPYVIEDATEYTKVGYYGEDVKSMIFHLIEAAQFDIEKAERGMIIIDEIDKKAGGDPHDVGGVEVLRSLLKMVEGTTIEIELPEPTKTGEYFYSFNTSNVIFVFLGAFSGIEEIKKKRLGKKKIGFGTQEEIGQKAEKYVKRDLIEYGMTEEFAGRIDTIVTMNTLTKEDLVLILKRSQLSIFKKYQRELKKVGIILSYSGYLFQKIAEKSLAVDTGARELKNTVDYIFEKILYDVFSNMGRYHKCVLENDIVEDNTKYYLS